MPHTINLGAFVYMCPECGYNVPYKTKKGGALITRLHEKKCVPVPGFDSDKIEKEMEDKVANKLGRNILSKRQLARLNERTDLDEDWQVHDIGRK